MSLRKPKLPHSFSALSGVNPTPHDAEGPRLLDLTSPPVFDSAHKTSVSTNDPVLSCHVALRGESPRVEKRARDDSDDDNDEKRKTAKVADGCSSLHKLAGTSVENTPVNHSV